MQSALVATLGHPRWWVLALGAFLVRGGILLVLLPIVSLPSAAGVATAITPGLETLILGTPTLGAVLLGAALGLFVIALLLAAGLTGSWLDLALVREAAGDEDVDVAWAPVRVSAVQSLGIRLVAHLPTLAAIAYASVRVVVATYQEALSPGNPALPMAFRVIERIPDAVLVLIIAWLAGEILGSLAARRASAGASVSTALKVSARQLASARGLATAVVTSTVVVGLVVPFLLVVGRAWVHLRAYLLEGVDDVHLGAALVLLVASWILGLGILGAGLAWRAVAWTAEVESPSAPVERPLAAPASASASEVAPG
jgi:hypothetical protein